ncbi:hypothetical protein LCE31_33905, partial [Streptomyces sp. 8L]|nr:hypothetical protein [Streptomyces sp. 8L]
MSKQGERSAPADDWWNRLYDETSPDTGAGAPTPGDTLDDRFASATHAVSVPEPPREAREAQEPGEAVGACAADEVSEEREARGAAESEDAVEPYDARNPLRDGGYGSGGAGEAEGARQDQESSHRRPPAWWEKDARAPWEAVPYVPSDARPLPSPRGGPAEPPPASGTADAPRDTTTPPPPGAQTGAAEAPQVPGPVPPADAPQADQRPADAPQADQRTA